MIYGLSLVPVHYELFMRQFAVSHWLAIMLLFANHC